MQYNDNPNDINRAAPAGGVPHDLPVNEPGTTGMGRESAMGAGTMGGPSDTASTEGKLHEAADTVKEKASAGAQAVRDQLGNLREKATTLKASLADKMDAGAQKLRQRAATGAGETERLTAEPGGTQKVEHKVASGLESTATWLRETDLDSLRTDVENQVRSHPGRTLLIALGLGYLVGRAVRGGGGQS